MLKRALQTTTAFAAATLVVACGVWMGGGFARAEAAAARPAGAAEAQGAYPARSSEGEVPLGDALAVNGQPMQLSLFFTTDPPGRVIAWYQDALAKKGLVPVARAEEQVGHVSVFDPDDGLQRFVTALPQGDGETLVMVGITNPRNVPRLVAGARSAPFPVPEANRGYLSYASEDSGTRALSAQFVTRLAPREVLGFYRDALAKDGYAEQKDDASEAMGIWSKGPVSLSVAVQALDAKAGAAVFVNRIEGAAK